MAGAIVVALMAMTSCQTTAEVKVTDEVIEKAAAQAEAEAAEAAAQAEAEAAEAAAQAEAEAAAQAIEQAKADALAAVEASYFAMAGVVMARVNELSLIGLDQQCVASGLREKDVPVVADPGRPLSEFDATLAAQVMIDCDALGAYFENLNQLGLGPTLTDDERACLRQYVGELSGSDFNSLLISELIGEAGVIQSMTDFDNVYNATFEGADACGIEW